MAIQSGARREVSGGAATFGRDVAGPATIAGYTVVYAAGAPVKAIAVCDIDDGTRTVVASENVELLRSMTREEFCGRKVRLCEDGEFVPIA